MGNARGECHGWTPGSAGLPLPVAALTAAPAALRARAWREPGEMGPPALPRLPLGPLLLLLVLLEAARCGEAAAPRPRDAATASPRPTEAAGGAATRSSSSSSSRLAEVSAPPEQGQPMTQRALSVLVLASAALIVYFVIRTVR